jgi:CRISPR-associated protein Csm5
MKQFIHTEALSITPLTPVHIGCGEDFEPTNYVIHDEFLHYFEPLDLHLSQQDRDAITKAVKKGGAGALLEIQRFFYSRREAFAGMARGMVAVAPGVLRQYEKRVGKVAQTEDGSINQLEIERTSHHPHTGQPYLPGSSLKGALRTGWLDFLNGGKGKASYDERARGVEERLLRDGHGSKFEHDAFRLLGLADADADSVLSKIMFACNHKKRLPNNPGAPERPAQGVTTRRQVVLGGQFRAFRTELRTYPLEEAGAAPRPPAAGHRIKSFQELAKGCNQFYRKRMAEILAVLKERVLANPVWQREFESLVAQLEPALDSGDVLLLRVGRHSGAESVTPDGLREIEIRSRRGERPERSATGGKTVWLASDEENARSDMQPFGWVLIERADAVPAPGLEAWCAAERWRHGLDVAAIEAKRNTTREVALAAREKARAEEETARHLAAEEAAREEARKRQLESATPQQQEILQFVARCEEKIALNQKDPFNPGTGLYQAASTLSRSALADGSPWSPEERQQLAEAIEENLPKVLQGYDAKAARRKLNLNALKGIA